MDHGNPERALIRLPTPVPKVESSQTGSLENDGKISKDCSGKKNGENDHMETECTEEVEKNQRPSNHGKRSPSWDSGQQPKKRVRHDSQRDIFEHKKRKTTAELNAECEASIRKVEPDAHLLQAKTLKREADKLTDKEAKSRTYVEAIVRFICCGKALEDKDDGELRAGQMYSETTELLRFILKHVLGKTEDKRLLILCLRIQSLLLHKLYRMKGKQAVRNTQTLAEHFKATNKNNMTSPYTSSTTSNKHGSTPSPMSPTPSPAGSVGSIGSNGSNSSGEGNHSQNGRHASTASVTSPVSVSIPQKIHSMMAQHVSNTSKLVNSIDMWDKADSLTSDYHEFFTTVDSVCGALTFHSSIPHIVSYLNNCLSTLHEHGKGT